MSKLLIPEPPLQVLPTLAKLIGLNDALFLQQLHYWLLRATREKEGRKWVYKSYDEWRSQDFPFWSTKTIQRIVERLEDRKLIITTSSWNRMPIDNTKWYTIDYAAVDDLTSGQVDQMVRTKSPDASGQNVQMVMTDWLDESGQSVQTNNQRSKTTTETTEPEITTIEDGGDGGFVFRFYEDERFGELTPMVGELLGEMVDSYGEQAVIEAMTVAVKNNARKLSYVGAVLANRAGSSDDDDTPYISGKYKDDIDY